MEGCEAFDSRSIAHWPRPPCGRVQRQEQNNRRVVRSAGRPNSGGTLFRPARPHTATARGASIRAPARATAT